MTSIAVQTAVGEVGSKATTELSIGFNSMINLGSHQIGANDTGLFRLNAVDGVFTRTVTLATTDLGLHNKKRARRLFVGIVTDAEFTVSVKFDNQAWKDRLVPVKKTGLQVVKVPVGRNGKGRCITVKVTSENWFRLDSINGIFIVRSSGIGGY